MKKAKYIRAPAQGHYYLRRQSYRLQYCLGDMICMLSKAIDFTSGTINFYHAERIEDTWDRKWSSIVRQLIDVLHGGERVKLHTGKEVPKGAYQMNKWFDKNAGEDYLPKHFSNGVPYAKINWDKVHSDSNRLSDLDLNYDKTICWFRRPQSHQPSRPKVVNGVKTFKHLSEVPHCLKKKYNDFNFLNLGEPFGGWDESFQGSLSRKNNLHRGSGAIYDFHTVLFLMKKCHKILNTDSGGMHLGLTAVDIDKLLYYEGSKNWDTWQSNMYYKMGVTFFNKSGRERVCPENERRYLH